MVDVQCDGTGITRARSHGMSSSAARHGTCVGITNSRLNAAKRGVAVEVGARVAAMAHVPVCLLAADPTDRDVERHLPQLVVAWGEPSRMQVTRGPHRLVVANFERADVCVVGVSDRDGIEQVLPYLQERFRFIVVDAPSRTGTGVGIADVLLDWLDALVVATGLMAGELAETRRYVERVESWPSARTVDVKVLAVGDPDGSGLAHSQLESRLNALPTIARVPRLAGHASSEHRIAESGLDDAFRPLVRWIVERPRPAPDALAHGTATDAASMGHHVANELYRANGAPASGADR